MDKSRSGFTIVELLIVIVVIAIIATISVVAYSGIQTRARASAIISDLKATEKALNAYKIASGASAWWIDNDTALVGAANPGIDSIITAQPEFRNYLQTAPRTDGLGSSSYWAYDNDGDVYNGCSANVNGVNLILGGSTSIELMTAIDRAIDDGNLSCGKIRHRTADNYFVYGLD